MPGSPTRTVRAVASLLGFLAVSGPAPGWARDVGLRDCVYDVGELSPRDSRTTLQVGDRAPEFSLPSVTGESVSLARYRGEKNVVISFVPAAWTPVCSAQWPQYDAARAFFEERNTVLLGITVDNVPTLFAWTRQLSPDGTGFWFPVLSDFYPHGAVSAQYGVLRSAGTSERALFVIDRAGIIRYLEVMDINRLPHFSRLERALLALD
jgi:peroxiredoxin (alkyl hydroperoxide reductase subunit C)